MKLFAIAFALSAATGCLSDEQVRQRDFGIATDEAAQLAYFKDPRTNLCFMGHDLAFKAAVIANVPCTPEVEREIAAEAAKAARDAAPQRTAVTEPHP